MPVSVNDILKLREEFNQQEEAQRRVKQEEYLKEMVEVIDSTLLDNFLRESVPITFSRAIASSNIPTIENMYPELKIEIKNYP